MGGEVITKRSKKRNCSSYPQNNHTSSIPKNQYHYTKKRTISSTHSHSKIEVLENITKSEHKRIANKIKNSLSKRAIEENVRNWKDQVAPAEKIMRDLISTIEKSPMSLIDKDMAYTFNIMAVEGHAANAHATFKSCYPNTTVLDVLDAIEKADPSQLRKYCEEAGLKKGTEGPINRLKKEFTKVKFQNRNQGYIDSTIKFQEAFLKGAEENISTIDKYSDSIIFKNNKTGTLNKKPCLKGLEAYMIAWMRGSYLTGSMDTFRGIRNEGFKKYGHQPGGGECHATNMKRLQEYGANLSDLSGINYQGALEPLNHLPHNTRLGVLKNLGIIIEKTLPLEDIKQGEYTWEKIKAHPGTTNLQKNPGIQDQYIREEKGLGVGDDKVILLAGFLPQTIFENDHKRSYTETESGILGGLESDFNDTVAKGSQLIMPGGQDYIGALHINGLYGRLAQDKRFRRRFGIKERPDGDYNLLPKDEIIAYTMAGVNLIGKILHSSQRHFYLDKKGTCMFSEILKLAYSHAMIRGIPMDINNMRNFKLNLGKNFDNTKFTYGNIPLREIKPMLNECLNLVYDKTPKERDQSIMQYLLPN